MSNLTTDNLTEKIKNGIAAGSNTMSLQTFLENITVDEAWIDSVESLLFSVEKIIRRPKTVIAENKTVVPVEKAKRITSETIRHLSSHTANIRGIADDGSVQPSKLLSTFYSDEFTIYENRFLCLLITQLFILVDRQHKAIDTAIPSEKTKTHHICDFNINDAKIEYEMSISFTVPQKESYEIKQKFNKRLEDLHKRISILRSTEFYRTIKKMKQIHPPIMKTNIIKSDVDYNNAYRLWLLIGGNDSDIFTLEATEKQLPIPGSHEEDLAKVCAVGVQTFIKSLQKQDATDATYKLKKPKKFKIWRNYNYVPQLGGKKEPKSMDALDFYDDRMRAMFAEKILPDDDAVAEIGDKSVVFDTLYQNISEINDSIYYDLLGVDVSKFTPLDGETAREKKEREHSIATNNAAMLKILAQHKEKDAKATAKLAEKYKSRADKLVKEIEKQIKDDLAKAKREEAKRLKEQLAREKAEKARLRKEQLAREKEEKERLRDLIADEVYTVTIDDSGEAVVLDDKGEKVADGKNATVDTKKTDATAKSESGKKPAASKKSKKAVEDGDDEVYTVTIDDSGEAVVLDEKGKKIADSKKTAVDTKKTDAAKKSGSGKKPAAVQSTKEAADDDDEVYTVTIDDSGEAVVLDEKGKKVADGDKIAVAEGKEEAVAVKKTSAAKKGAVGKKTSKQSNFAQDANGGVAAKLTEQNIVIEDEEIAGELAARRAEAIKDAEESLAKKHKEAEAAAEKELAEKLAEEERIAAENLRLKIDEEVQKKAAKILALIIEAEKLEKAKALENGAKNATPYANPGGENVKSDVNSEGGDVQSEENSDGENIVAAVTKEAATDKTAADGQSANSANVEEGIATKVPSSDIHEGIILTKEILERIIKDAEERAENELQSRIAAEQKRNAEKLAARKAKARARTEKKLSEVKKLTEEEIEQLLAKKLAMEEKRAAALLEEKKEQLQQLVAETLEKEKREAEEKAKREFADMMAQEERRAAEELLQKQEEAQKAMESMLADINKEAEEKAKREFDEKLSEEKRKIDNRLAAKKEKQEKLASERIAALKDAEEAGEGNTVREDNDQTE